jgi:hypothetical protein
MHEKIFELIFKYAILNVSQNKFREIRSLEARKNEIDLCDPVSCGCNCHNVFRLFYSDEIFCKRQEIGILAMAGNAKEKSWKNSASLTGKTKKQGSFMASETDSFVKEIIKIGQTGDATEKEAFLSSCSSENLKVIQAKIAGMSPKTRRDFLSAFYRLYFNHNYRFST